MHCCIVVSIVSLRGGCRLVPLERAGRHARGVADAELRRFLVLLVKVLFGERGQLGAVFLFNGGSLAVELLNVFEPGDSVADPNVGAFEAVLGGGCQFCLSRSQVRKVGIEGGHWRQRVES